MNPFISELNPYVSDMFFFMVRNENDPEVIEEYANFMTRGLINFKIADRPSPEELIKDLEKRKAFMNKN